ncbi:hypothetical protein J3R82DRAFT_11593 [Butyriboletus roseoflavus]|nr:hypothetical protein J3R82DRAFT_11593 [Butyriboletus roseoflavus]
MLKLKINHVPWSQSPKISNRRGHHLTTILHTIWLPLGTTEPTALQNNVCLLSTEETHQADLIAPSNDITLNNPCASWSACQYRLSNFHKILHKTCLPSKWSIQHASLPLNNASEFGMTVYAWVENNYDPINNPIHVLGLFIAIIFAGMIPSIFPLRKLVSQMNWLKLDLQNYFADLPWEDCSDKKGASQVELFITMVLTFIITVLDERSSLAITLHAHHSK